MYANSLPSARLATPLNYSQSLASLLAIAWVYLSVGAILGFFQGLLPVLKAQGASLTDLRWIFVIYLPFGLCFVWASLIDRHQRLWPGWHRGWVFFMHALASLAGVGLAFTALSNVTMLMLIGLVLCASLATADLAMDAYCVRYLPANYRLHAATAKLAGLCLGQLLGGAVLIANFARLGWQTCLLVLAILILSGASSAFLLPAKELATNPHQTSYEQSRLVSALRDSELRAILWRVILLSCSLLALFSFNRLFLADLHLPLATIAWTLGGIVPLVNALVCLSLPLVVKHVKLSKVMHSASALTVAATVGMLIAYYQHQALLGLIAAVANCAAATAVYVGLASLILSYANPQRAATDYSLLYSLGRLIAMVNLLILPGLIQAIGWLAYFSVVIVIFTAAYFSLSKFNTATLKRGNTG